MSAVEGYANASCAIFVSIAITRESWKIGLAGYRVVQRPGFSELLFGIGDPSLVV